MTKSKEEQEEKIKRTFTLRESVISKLYRLKADNPKTNLSTFIEEAVELYYQKNKKEE
jgi:hypothetical protein